MLGEKRKSRRVDDSNVVVSKIIGSNYTIISMERAHGHSRPCSASLCFLVSGSVGRQVSQCKGLRLLDLGSNRFTGSAPIELLGVANLTYFNASWNMFEQEVPDMIGSCSGKLELEVFDVSGNALYGEIPPSITKCSGLKYLDLGFNRLSGSISVGISGLKNLVFLRLANNSIDGMIHAGFGRIEYLQVLDLHNLRLGGEVPDAISNCQFLLKRDDSDSLEGGFPQNLFYYQFAW